MKLFFKGLLIFLAVTFVIFLTKKNSNESPKILIGAAASLQPVLQELNEKYPKNIDYNFASSGVLQQQIEQGATIDVFISASAKQMDTLEEKQLLLPDTRQNLLINKLVLITAKENPLSLNNFTELLESKIKLIAIGETRSVPAGQYAKEVFENLGILAPLQSKFIFGNNVRETLTHVETGNADAGIVYLTDAKSSNKVKIISIVDEKLHTKIVYPMAVIKSSKYPDLAKQYLEFLQSDVARKIFEKYGFYMAK